MHKFKEQKLFERCFKRRDYDNEDNYELLEFLGDQVLGMVVTKALVESGYTEDEGLLTRLRQALVCEAFLSERLEDLNLQERILFGKNDIINNVDGKQVEADVFEAIVGAIAIDSGWDWDVIARETFTLLGMDISTNERVGFLKNYMDLKAYRFNTQGPDAPFVCGAIIDGYYYSGTGKTRLEARIDCVRNILAFRPKKSKLELCGFMPSITESINQIQILVDKGLLEEKPFIEEGYRIGKMWHYIKKLIFDEAR